MKLDIIVRTHSKSNVHTAARTHERYVGAPKSEVLLRCVNSLIVSINAAEADIRVWVLDDTSDEPVLNTLRTILQKCRYPTELIQLPPEKCGVQGSALAQFEAGKTYGRDMVYFVEDDYLHTPSAIEEMIGSYELFKRNLGGQEVALFPCDYPDRYMPHEIEPTRVVYGSHRHWRTVRHTTYTCMLSHSLLVTQWQHFETLAKNYKLDPRITEENTINVIWRECAVLFSPIPSLALHLQFKEHKDPYIDWRAWWDAAQY